MRCKKCDGICIKKGFQKGIQKYYCKGCRKYSQSIYSYKKCTAEDERMIVRLTNEGVGISGVARITGISKSNVINKIKEIAGKIERTVIVEEQQEYELDEMYTFIGNKDQPCYIIYALNKMTKVVIDFIVGRRTKENISGIVQRLRELNPKCIYTDKLNIYPALISNIKHVTAKYKINHIERMNLNIRTHLKRLSRRTICFSRSKEMLESCLKVYFYELSVKK